MSTEFDHKPTVDDLVTDPTLTPATLADEILGRLELASEQAEEWEPQTARPDLTGEASEADVLEQAAEVILDEEEV